MAGCSSQLAKGSLLRSGHFLVPSPAQRGLREISKWCHPAQPGCSSDLPGLNPIAKYLWKSRLEKNKSPAHSSLLF